MNSYHMRLDPKSLVPADDNPQRMSPSMFSALKSALAADVDTIDDPAVWKDGDSYRIISGHHRVKAASELGWSEVSVKVFDDPACTELWYRKRLLSVNKTHGDPDDDAIRLFLENTITVNPSSLEVDLREFLSDTGYSRSEVNEFINDMTPYHDRDADDIPSVVIPRSKTGDLWILGKHRLLCGDATSEDDVIRLMDGSRASLFATDPPYGINHVEVSQEKGQSKGYQKIQNDELQDEKLQEFIFKVISAGVKLACKENFAFYMWHAMKMQGYAAAAAAAAGILFHRQIIWVKPQFVFGRGHYHWRHELCLMGWLQGSEPPFYGERNQSTIWEVGRENDKIHPTQKPVEISERPILNHTQVGDICYEPFSGSGSQLIACEKTGRRCFGLEIDHHYCDVIIARWEAYTGQKAELMPQ